MSWYACASRVPSYNTNSVFPWEPNPRHASTVSPHRSISFPGTSLTDLAQTKLCRGLPPLNCLNVCSSLNTTLLQSFLVLALVNRNRPRLWVSDNREALRCLSACKSRRRIVLCTVMELTSATFCFFSSLAITRLERRFSPALSSPKVSFSALPSSEPESLYLDIQRR